MEVEPTADVLNEHTWMYLDISAVRSILFSRDSATKHLQPSLSADTNDRRHQHDASKHDTLFRRNRRPQLALK